LQQSRNTLLSDIMTASKETKAIFCEVYLMLRAVCIKLGLQ
jgi:hypothetical protein